MNSGLCVPQALITMLHSSHGIWWGLVPGHQWIPKSTDAQVPYVNLYIIFAYNLYTLSPVYFKSS